MAGQKFGQAVNRKVRAVFERTDQQRRREGIIDQQRRARLFAPVPRCRSRSPTRSSGFEMVSITMQPGLASAIFCSQRRQIADIDEIHRHAHRLQHLRQQRGRGAIERIRRQHRLAPIRQRGEQGHMNGHHARRANLRARSRFELGQQLFQAACAWGCRNGRSRSRAPRGPARDPAWPCLRRGKWWRCRSASMTEQKLPARRDSVFRSPACTALVSIFMPASLSFPARSFFSVLQHDPGVEQLLPDLVGLRAKLRAFLAAARSAISSSTRASDSPPSACVGSRTAKMRSNRAKKIQRRRPCCPPETRPRPWRCWRRARIQTARPAPRRCSGRHPGFLRTGGPPLGCAPEFFRSRPSGYLSVSRRSLKFRSRSIAVAAAFNPSKVKLSFLRYGTEASR